MKASWKLRWLLQLTISAAVAGVTYFLQSQLSGFSILLFLIASYLLYPYSEVLQRFLQDRRFLRTLKTLTTKLPPEVAVIYQKELEELLSQGQQHSYYVLAELIGLPVILAACMFFMFSGNYIASTALLFFVIYYISMGIRGTTGYLKGEAAVKSNQLAAEEILREL